MAQPLCERLRQAVRDFKQVAAARARLEMETEAGFRERTRVIEREYQDDLLRIDNAYQEELAAAEQEVQEARTNVLALFDGDAARATQEAAKAKRSTIRKYAQAKEQAQADFQEARWTITTVHDAGRKVAKDALAAAQASAQAAVERLQTQQQQALRLLEQWQFAGDLAIIDAPTDAVYNSDPVEAMERCASEGAGFLSRMQALKLPNYVGGVRPFLVIGLIWLLASLPAFLLGDNAMYWLAATTATVIPIGVFIRWWLKARARTQARYLWSGLAQAAIDAGHLQPLCLDLAKQAYRKQKSENKRRNQAALNQAAATIKKTVKELRQRRNQKLRQAQATFEPLTKMLTERRDRDLLAVEATFETKQAEFTASREQQLGEIGERFKKLRDEINRQHADDWTRLVSQWKEGCDHFLAASRAVDQETRRWFPSWQDPAWQTWRLPDEIPLGLVLGKFDLRLEDIPHGVPKEIHLQRPDFANINFPILLSFPERASLLLKAQDEGKARAILSLQALLMRCWTALPAGKARCTIIDPVGRGENFAAFMHLADHEEVLVNSRIWTEAASIDQRLTDLTAHMENVLQKYLRNQFETLAEYNAQAGEVAEPYRFLVVADFPVNFTPDAARRLISLAGAGARCGIYTFIMVDTKQALPPGIDLADLQRVCTTFAWKHDHYAWFDLDFGSFPMELEAPPDAEACTSLLQLAGAEAKRAGRVEVPFELIAIPAEDWWREDSRAGLSVPLGRAGATALQQLTLGKGTSQHVLIAGKTGSGKSTLLHVLIAQLAMRYSPAEVELFLIDFKKGVEFKTYATNELPHARVVAIESEREFGLSVLQRLDAELMRRGDLFRAAGVNDLPSYRNLAEPIGANGAPRTGPLPRLVLVVDEFQEFFVEDDKTSQEAALLLDRLVRQGRAFGIHILLGSQTLGGAYSLARSTIDQMAVRIALQCSETDAHLILSKDNSDARLLSRPGEAIYNAAGGLLEGNHLFQVVWLSDAKRDACLGKVRHLGRERNLWTNQIVFEGTAPADVARNTLLAEALTHPNVRAPREPVQAWLGEAVAIKDPTAAIFRRQSGGNLLMIGQQDELAFSMAVAAVAGLSAQLPPLDQEAPCLQLLIAHALEGEAASVHDLLPEVLPLRLLTQRDLASTLELLNEEVNRRLKGERDGPPRFLFLHGLQRLRDLRRPDDDFGYTRKGETTVSPYKQFMNILREGPSLGVFTIVWCDALANLQRTFDRQGLREFEMRVLFQMSPTDSSTLMDTPLASKLGMHRALLYTEDQGRLEKFRPYGLPTLEWLRRIAANQYFRNSQMMRFLSFLWLLLVASSLGAQTGVPGFKVPPGFVVTEFADHNLANDIFCMTVDAKGRIVVAGRGYIRILVDDDGDGRADRAIDFAAEPKDGAMGLCWEGDTLLVMGDGGLRRLVDKDGDGKADGPSELIRAMKTGGEHCAHALRRGPDGWLYVLCGNTTDIDKRYSTLPTSPIKDPIAGCILRFTPDFKQSEIVAHGFRNPYDMDFNQDGELFTFDSDNERCVSLPWYEPTRFYHVQEGGFYGWLAPQRANFWRLPPYFVDVVAPVAYLGRGSPTGVACYRHTQFPPEYHGGMFLCDWTFGKVHFAALKRQGASYESKTKVFLEATGDNGFAPTAALVHPQTGDLFIAIGGRGTRGAVYRVRYEKGQQYANDTPMKAARSLEWTGATRERAIKSTVGASLPDRLWALQTMNRFPAQFSELSRVEAFKVNGDNPDRAIHQACVTLLRNLLPALNDESKKKLETDLRTSRSLLTLAHAYATIDPAKTLPLLTMVASDQDERTCLDVLRVVQIALGDIGSPRARGALWEGYSLRAPLPNAKLAELGRKIVMKAGRGIGKDIHQEFFRTAALLEMDFDMIRAHQWPALQYQPPSLVHDYACLACLPGKRRDTDTAATADALLSLDRLATEGKWNRDLNWPLRIDELYQGLADKDVKLPAAMLAHAEFGRPDHVLFTRAKGIDRKKAAAIFLNKIATDKAYPLNPAIVLLLGELPDRDVLQVLRPRWGSTGVESALLPILAKQPLPEDRTRFIDGLALSQPGTLAVCLAALEKLPAKDDGSESLALIRALSNVPDKQKDLRTAVARRLASISGQKLAEDKAAWTAWFTRAHPEKAARLNNPDGVDVATWTARLASLEWDKGQDSRGHKVFIKASCVNCHSGSQAMGPDLAGVAGRFSRADLFTAIIQPSRDVPARYQTTVVETADGKIYQGLVIYDAVDSLILQTGPATTVRLSGEAVIGRRVSPLSLMPPGLLDRLDDQEIVDLYAYLKSMGKKK